MWLKNRLEGERAWFLTESEGSEPGNRASFSSLGKNLCVFEPHIPQSDPSHPATSPPHFTASC